MEIEKQKQREYYDRSAKPLLPLSVGDSIQYQEGKTLKQGIVTKEEGDRSYTVKSTDRAVYRRNRRHLIQSGEKFDTDLDHIILQVQFCLANHTQKPQPEIKHIDSAPFPTSYVICYGKTVQPKSLFLCNCSEKFSQKFCLCLIISDSPDAVYSLFVIVQ